MRSSAPRVFVIVGSGWFVIEHGRLLFVTPVFSHAAVAGRVPDVI